MRWLIAIAVLASVAAACTSTASPAPTAQSTTVATPTTAPTPSAAPSLIDVSDTIRFTIWRALADTIDTGTARFVVTGTFDGVPTIPDGRAFTISGSTSFAFPAELAFDGDFSGLGVSAINLISQGEQLYLKGDFLKPFHVPSGKWLVVDATSTDPKAAPFLDIRGGENDASVALFYLYGLGLPIERLTPNQRFGITTQAYAGDIQLLHAIPFLTDDDQGAAVLKSILGLQKDLPGDITAEVWIADGLIRELTYGFGLASTDAGGVLRVTYAFDEFGEPLDLSIPAPNDLIAFEDLP